MNYKIFTLVILLFFTTILHSQVLPTFEWVKSNSEGYSRVVSIVTGKSGDVYVFGYFADTVDFDPGPNVYNLVSTAPSSYTDVFIQKLSATGDFIWAKRIEGPSITLAYAMDIDSSENIFVTGHFQGTMDLDPSSNVFQIPVGGGNASGTDIYIAKIDLNGNFIWGGHLPSNGIDYVRSLKVDKSQNIYIAGTFSSSADFDPNTGVFNLSAVNNRDAFVLKLDNSGNLLWAKSFGGTGHDECQSLALDNSGNCLLTGFFNNTVDFDPGVGIHSITGGDYDNIFVLKLDTNGDFLWANAVFGAYSEQGTVINVDSSENIFVAGRFWGTLDFDPGPSTYNLTAIGSGFNGYLQKLDANGNFIWAKQTAHSSILPNGMKLDNLGNIYITGPFSDTVDFDPGPNSANLIANGSNTFIQKLDNNGNYVWATSIKGKTTVEPIHLDANSNIYIGGDFRDSIDFDIGSTVYSLSTPPLKSRSFLLKMSPNTITSILPIEITSFKAKRANKSTIKLNWEISNETDLDYYEIERAYEYHMQFSKVGEIKANNSTYYEYIDDNASEQTSYYRLRTINMDGETEYSSTKAVEGISNHSVFAEIYPNPIFETINIRFKEKTEQVYIKIYDIYGKQVMDEHITSSTNYLIRLDNIALAAGVYIINLESSTGERLSRKFVKH